MPIRVLVVDDSVVVRRVLARTLDANPDFELAGSAADGRAALTKIERVHPDVIVLDLEMPVMDGFEVLRRLQGQGIPVVVFSYLTASGAVGTLEALSLGATDFVLKPTSAQGIGLAEDYVTSTLLPILRAVTAPKEPTPPPKPTAVVRRASQMRAVAIVVSTGGPNALAQVVADLAPDFPVPILIVQHMPPGFTTQLAERLDRIGSLPVHEAVDGQVIEPGHVYLAPGGRHMAVKSVGRVVRAVIHDAAPENSCRPSGDVLFRAAASVYGEGLLALVMTGMGHDGMRGAEAVRAAGGVVLAQDGESSVVGGMPRAVEGIATSSIPLDNIAAELTRWTAR